MVVASENGPLFKLAAAIADGSGVDWNGVVSTPEESSVVEQLRVIAKIAGMHLSEDRPQYPMDAPEAPPSASAPGEPSNHTPTDLGRWGDLILIEEVGRGSFGTVYRAHDPQLDRPVAVKLLRSKLSADEQLKTRLLHEGRTLASVHHANVVTVYGAGEHEGRLGLWMEFIRGLTLERMLKSHGPFSAGEAGIVGYELCGALAAVHRAGLVHRDIKAQNVMREEGGRLILMDFGAGQKRSETGIVTRRVVGTPLYLAPEVLSGAEATIASDIYSLGVLLYHLVTNDYPVKGDTVGELVVAHARGRVTRLEDLRPHLPRSFVRVVERAIDPDPSKRFDSAGRMGAAFGRIHASSADHAVVPRLRTVRRPRLTRQASVHDAGVPSVAVLPFSDMSPAKDQECFCDGITEEIINALTQIPGLRVAARTSAFQFKRQARDVRQIGEALNVATILDGSVRKDGNRVRITVELIGSAEGYHLWSRRFDRDLIDIFAVQDDIATAVVTMLKGKLAVDKSRPAVVTPRSQDLDAYESYLEGRYHWNKRTEDELKRSVACFERAVAKDPGYAQAYAGMADAFVMLGTYGAIPAKDVMSRAKAALENAIRLDSGSAEAYACRGCVRSVYDWSWSDAEDDFRRAIDANSSYPTAHHWYAINHLVPLGRFQEAHEELNRALELDPLALAIKTSVGMTSYFAGHYDVAAQELSKTIDLDQGFGMAHFFLGATYTEQGRYVEALQELEAAIRLSGRNPEVLAALGYLYGVSGRIDDARSVLDELVQLADDRYVSPSRLAQVHVGLGERAQALDQLEAAHAQKAADLAWLGVRPVFASLRAEPRFVTLLSKMGLAASAKT
jgi:serine/threonine protein kinase/tetratricopeptide (TPR) repeat protein